MGDKQKEVTLNDLFQILTENKQKLDELVTDVGQIKKDLKVEKEKTRVLGDEMRVLKGKVETMTVEMAAAKKDIVDLKSNVNDREQYNRSWSVRITGLQVTKEDEEKLGVSRAVMKTAFDKLIKPILTAAKAKGAVETVPTAYHNCLENGHKIFRRPGRGRRGDDGDGDENPSPPQIIVRFCSRYIRNVVLMNKREAMPKPTMAEVTRGVQRYGLFEDLTARNYALLRAAIEDKRVKKVWTVDGRLKFTTEEDPDKVNFLGNAASLDEFFKSK